MSREIRITVADDEVFERMRRRKDRLDLSWEEALRRGLSEDGADAARTDANLDPFDENFGEQLRERIRSRARTDAGGEEARNRGASSDAGRRGFDPFDPDDIGTFVRDQIQAAVSGTPTGGDSLDSELDELAEAEDAMLTFPFLEGSDAAVPLRVTLRTTGDGLDVEVVTVRRGADTAARNQFPGDSRQRVAAALAEGETATLSLQDGAETYAVVPSLAWDRTEDGTPTVGEVTVEQVVLE